MEKDITQVVENTYNAIAKDFEEKVPSHNLDHRFIEKYLASFSPGQKILDLGAGTGVISNEMMHEHQLDVTAIDLSKEMIDLARENYPDLKILKMDISKLEFSDSHFDGVFAMYSLIHIADPEIPQALKEIHRVLKPSGMLYLALQEPITIKDKDGFYPLIYKPEIKMFINLFTEKEMCNHLEKAGFEVSFVDRRPPSKDGEFQFNKLFIFAKKIE